MRDRITRISRTLFANCGQHVIAVEHRGVTTSYPNSAPKRNSSEIPSYPRPARNITPAFPRPFSRTRYREFPARHLRAPNPAPLSYEPARERRR